MVNWKLLTSTARVVTRPAVSRNARILNNDTPNDNLVTPLNL
jgi:hypothetical protein